MGVSGKVFDLDLPELGPYNLAFTRSGRHMLLGGRRGHLALLDWQQRHLVAEVQVSHYCLLWLSPNVPSSLPRELSIMQGPVACTPGADAHPSRACSWLSATALLVWAV